MKNTRKQDACHMSSKAWKQNVAVRTTLVIFGKILGVDEPNRGDLLHTRQVLQQATYPQPKVQLGRALVLVA